MIIIVVTYTVFFVPIAFNTLSTKMAGKTCWMIVKMTNKNFELVT